MNEHFRLHATSLLSAAAAAALAGQAAAADVRFAPEIEMGVMSDSNLRLQEGGGGASVAGAFAQVTFEVLASTPLAQLSVAPRLEATYFPQDQDRGEDYVNGGVGLLWTRRGRTVTSRFLGDVDRSSTVTGNRATAPGDGGELGDPDEVADSGALGRNRVNTMVLREWLGFELSDRNTLELGLGFTDRDFEEQSVDEDVSYVAFGGDVAWRWLVRERASVALRARAMRYNPELVPIITQNYGLEAEWRYQLSERLESYVRAGANRARYDSSAGANPDGRTAFVGGVGGSWRLRVSRVFLDATRSTEPNSAGYSVERSQLRLRLDRDFSPRVRGSLAGRLMLDEGPEGFNERRYGVGSVAVEWRLSRTVSLTGRYDHTWQDYKLTPGSAASNAFRLSLTYEPRRLAEDSASFMD